MSQPSAIARSVAAQQWPDVQQQRKVAKGVYSFSCAGHGGLVGVVDQLGLDEEVLVAARRAGLIHLVARTNRGRYSRNYCTASGYRRDDLLKLKERYPHHVELIEVWIGEEDCDWATLAYASVAVRDGLPHADFDDIRDIVQRYNGDFLEALEGSR